jgi:outer membrane protein assembly factor BamA
MSVHVKCASCLLIVLIASTSLSSAQQSTKASQARKRVEIVDVVGNRRLSRDYILSHVKTRSGETFSPKRSRRDLQKILALGVFDRAKTRIITEQGERGGVVVIFEVVEMPLILGVSLQGLRGITESEVFEALNQEHIDIARGAVYDPVTVRNAQRLIQRLLVSRGWPNAMITVMTFRQELSHVSIEFTISLDQG